MIGPAALACPEEATGPTRERRCSVTIVPLRCFGKRSSWAISPRCIGKRCEPKARPRSRAHRGAVSVNRPLGRGVAGGRRMALVAQTQLLKARGAVLGNY